jgi:transcriptional regulator with XRE-family HTH domain
MLAMLAQQSIRQQAVVLAKPEIAGGNMPNMTTTKQQRLASLVSRYKSQREFAEAVGMASAHVSQVLSGARNLGEAVARRIEHRLQLPHGWLEGTEDGPAVRLPDDLRVAMRQQMEVKREDDEAILSDLFYRLLAAGFKPDDINPNPRWACEMLGVVRFDFQVLDNVMIYIITPGVESVYRLYTYSSLLKAEGKHLCVIARMSKSSELNAKRYFQAIDTLKRQGDILEYCTDTEPEDIEKIISAIKHLI